MSWKLGCLVPKKRWDESGPKDSWVALCGMWRAPDLQRKGSFGRSGWFICLHGHTAEPLGTVGPTKLCLRAKVQRCLPRLPFLPHFCKSCLFGGYELCRGVLLSLGKDLKEDVTFLLIPAPLCPVALLCACTSCLQTNYTCETDGACMVSIFNLDGMEHHVRTCIPKVELVPAGKPFYCLSSEDLRNTHCCYSDFCNKIDLRVPSGEWTPFTCLPCPSILLCSFPVPWLSDS